MTDQPYHARRFRRALLHFLGGRAAQATARALLLLALVRVLAVEDYGAYMLVIGLAEMLLQVASFGILPVGQRYLPQLLTSLPARRLYRFVAFLVGTQLAVLVAVAMALWLFWPALAVRLNLSPAQIEATALAAWLFLLIPAFRFSAELLDALLEQGRAQIARALMPCLRLAGVGLLVVLRDEVGLADVLVVDIVVTAGCLLLAWFFLAGSLARLHADVRDGELPIAEMLRFGWHMSFVGLMSATGTPGALRMVLANALGVVESGLFAFLQSLQRLVSRYLPGTLLRGLVRPVLISRAIGEGRTSVLAAGTGLLLKSNLLIVAAGLIVTALAGDTLVEWLSGGKFEQAGLTLALLFVALIVMSQRTVIEMVMQITGHTRTLRVTAVISPVALVAVWAFADLGLNVAVLIIAAAGTLANWIAMTVLLRSTDWFRIDWRAMAAIFVPTAALIGAGLLLRGALPELAIAAAAFLLFCAAMLLTRPLSAAEAQIVERAAGRRASRVVGRLATP